MRTRRLVTTRPFMLSSGDSLRTFNASQEVWAKISEVYLSPNRRWTYLRVSSGYIPDPYTLRLLSYTDVTADKVVTWRGESPPPPPPEVYSSHVSVRTSRYRKKDQPTYGGFSNATWKPTPRISNATRRRRMPDDTLGFIPDPLMEKARARHRSIRGENKHAEQRANKPSLLPYYKELGCKAGNRLSTIRKRFKALVFKYHPDRNGGDKSYEIKLKKLNEAFSMLLRALDK